MMLFADLMSPDQVSNLIDLQILRYRQKQAEERVTLGPPEARGAQFLKGYGQAVFEAAIQYLETNRHLVEERDDFAKKDKHSRAAEAAAV